MNKRKIFTILAAIAIPVVVIAALFSTSSNLFKGSINTEIDSYANFSLVVTNPFAINPNSTSYHTENKNDILIGTEKLYIDINDSEPVFINYITNRDSNNYKLSILSSNEEIDSNTLANGFETFSDNSVPSIMQASGATEIYYGWLSDVEILLDSEDNTKVIEARQFATETNFNKNIARKIVWNKNCRYDAKFIVQDSIYGQDNSFKQTEFLNQCDTSLYHYLVLEVNNDDESRYAVLPITFEPDLNITFSQPANSNFKNTVMQIEDSSTASGFTYNQSFISKEPIFVDPSSTDTTMDFTFTLNGDFSYKVNLLGSYENIVREKTELYETDEIYSVELENDSNSNTLTYNWDKQCLKNSTEFLPCNNTNILDYQMIQFVITQNDKTVTYNFPLLFQETNNPNGNTISWVLPNQQTQENEISVSQIAGASSLANLYYTLETDEIATINVPKVYAGQTFPIQFASDASYRYKVSQVQVSDTTNLADIANQLDSGGAIELVTISESSEPKRGETTINWDGQCIDTNSNPEVCENNYLITEIEYYLGGGFTKSYNYIFPISFYQETELSIYWLYNKPFKNYNFELIEATNTYVDATPLQIDVASNPETNFYFSNNLKNTTFSAEISTKLSTGQPFVIASLAQADSDAEANQANKITWNNQCITSTSTTPSIENCLSFIANGQKVYFEAEFKNDTDSSEAIEPTEIVKYRRELQLIATESTEAQILSCKVDGDENIFNPNREGMLIDFAATSNNIYSFDYSLVLLDSEESQIEVLENKSSIESANGSFDWDGDTEPELKDGTYTVQFKIEDSNSSASCEDTWNFIVDLNEPANNEDLSIDIDPDEFKVPEETMEITLNQKEDSYRTVINVYKKSADEPYATIYACVAGEDTKDAKTPCDDDLNFEWDGSHFFNYMPEGKYYLRASILNSSNITTAAVSEDFTIEHGNIRNNASNGECTNYFRDIQPNDPLCNAVTFVREADIFYGTNGLIDVNRPLTRAEFITVTNRIKEQENSSTFRRVTPYSPQRDGNMGHSDLTQYVGDPNARWFLDEIWKAKQAGLIKGYVDGTMQPLKLIEGPEAFKLVQLATEVNSSTENKNPWYSDYTEFNYRYKIDTGGINEFTKAVTRGQLIYYIYQLNRAGLYTP